MKTIHSLSIALAASLLLACGGGGSDEPTPIEPGKFITLTKELPAAASEQSVALTGLNSAVTQMNGHNATASWLTVSKETYTSGTPRLTLRATENLQTKARQAHIVCIAAKDTLTLTVVQAVYDATTDVNTTHDTPTDQPAYIPRPR